jgi:hypothetical protein
LLTEEEGLIMTEHERGSDRLGRRAKRFLTPLQALADSKPGVQAARRDVELAAARAEAARLGEALKELAVRLLVVEGKGRWG